MSKEILVRDLEPGQTYVFQARAKDQYGRTSAWSTAYKVLTNSDVTAPDPVTDLTWDDSGTSFVATWVKPSLDSNAKPLKDFKDYRVVVTAGVNSVTYFVSQEKFDFPIEANINSFGQPEPELGISVRVRDIVGNLSSAVTSTASNPLPTDLVGLTALPIFNGITVSWDASVDDDLKTYEAYISTSGSGFTPGPSNIVYTGLGNSFVYQTDVDDEHFVKVRALDVFNQSTNYSSTSATPITTVEEPPDETPPSKPSVPTIASSPLSIQFSHDGTKDAGGDLEGDVEFLEVHFSPTTSFTPSESTLVTSVPFSGPGLPTITRIVLPVTTSVTTGFWKIIAVDTSGNKSVASDQVAEIPGLIENAYIENATITSAKIQSLSAAKLEAGTAIVNDLFIRSELVIDNNDGIIRSDNYNAGTKTGWKIDEDGLTIYDGVISAEALQIQDSQNIIPAIYADFEWNTSYYHNSSNIPNPEFFQNESTTRVSQETPSGGAKIGTKALRIYATGYASQNAVIFAAEDTYPLDVAGGETYIYSVWIKNKIASAYDIKLGFDHTLDGTTFDGETEWTITLNSSTSTWYRYYSIITLPSGAIGGAAYIEIPAGTNPDFYIDALQIERQTGGIEVPSPFTPPSSTTIDGGSIVTGVIRSSAPSPTAPDQPAWSLDATGSAQFGDVLIRGSATVGAGGDLTNSYIQSSNYVAATSGWIIRGDGTAQFNSLTIRGNSWTNVTLSGGWTNSGGSYANVSYKVMADGTLLFRGLASAGTTTDFTTVFTLPVGFRPTWEHVFHVRGAANASLFFQTSGAVLIVGLSGVTNLLMDGIRIALV